MKSYQSEKKTSGSTPKRYKEMTLKEKKRAKRAALRTESTSEISSVSSQQNK